MVWPVHVTWYGGPVGVEVPGRTERDGLVQLVQAVAATGGAVGWLAVPSPDEVDAWLAQLMASGARLAVANEDRRVLACGAWRREDSAVLRHVGRVHKVMTHPRSRGRGAARLVTEALVADARHAGIELLTLAARGNNHAAQRLYGRLGFVVTGRRPDALAVGDQRFDEVLMHLDLRRGTAGLIRRGSRKEGPGAT